MPMTDQQPAPPAPPPASNNGGPDTRHAVKDRARRQFDAWAHSYDRSIVQRLLFQPSYRMFMEELWRRRRDDPRPFDLLDIGCGTGTWIAMVAGCDLPARRLVGLDYADAMCRLARKKAAAVGDDRLHFVRGDAEHLPFEDASFDVLTCSNSFHHYPHQAAAIGEMRRVLRPGGRLMMVDGFRDNIVGWVLFDVFITRAESTPTARVYHAPWSVMRGYFQQAGFRDIEQHKTGVLVPIFLTTGVV
jgi:ubiquinone/menaquinone biosynthesis C-methylase UbiE